MSARYKMPTFERATHVAAILQGIGIDAWEEQRSGQPYLVVPGDHRGLDAAIRRLEPRARNDC